MLDGGHDLGFNQERVDMLQVVAKGWMQLLDGDLLALVGTPVDQSIASLADEILHAHFV